jgi:arsenate reductase
MTATHPGISMSLTIYHNPRCSKSRKTLELIESRGIQPTIVEYLSTPPDASTLLEIAGQLGMPLADLLRRGEAEFKEAGDSVPLDDENRLAAWIVSNPKVLQRPIVVDTDSGRAIVGRPPENVFDLIGQ